MKLAKLKMNLINFLIKKIKKIKIDVLNKPLKLTQRDLSPLRSWRQRKKKENSNEN